MYGSTVTVKCQGPLNRAAARSAWVGPAEAAGDVEAPQEPQAPIAHSATIATNPSLRSRASVENILAAVDDEVLTSDHVVLEQRDHRLGHVVGSGDSLQGRGG